MIAPASPMVRRRRLAAELRGIREGKGKSGDTVAHALRWSPSKISRYERARTGLRPREVERLLDYYQITGPRRTLLLELAEDAAQKGWWEEFADSLSDDYQQFIGLEHEATSMAIWHVDVVTGLLQTEAYARHIIASYSRVERCIGEHLKCDPVQVCLPLPFQGETAPHVLGADHILHHRIAVSSEAENDEGLPEDRMLRVKRKNLQRQIRPVSLVHEALKLLIHHRVITDPAP